MQQSKFVSMCTRVKALFVSNTSDAKRPILIVWGDGGFGPTSRGHASAPNKKMQKILSTRFPLILSSERNTSKFSSCCQAPVCKTSPHPDHAHSRRRPRSDVLVCSMCKRLLSRDLMAAKNILRIFRESTCNAVPSL